MATDMFCLLYSQSSLHFLFHDIAPDKNSLKRVVLTEFDTYVFIEQKIQWTKVKKQNKRQIIIYNVIYTTTHKAKDWATRTSLKPGVRRV